MSNQNESNPWPTLERQNYNLALFFSQKMGMEIQSDQYLEHCLLGLVGEVGEVCDLIKKIQVRCETIESHKYKLSLELADVWMYLQDIALSQDIDLAQAVADKMSVVVERITEGDGTSQSDLQP